MSAVLYCCVGHLQLSYVQNIRCYNIFSIYSLINSIIIQYLFGGDLNNRILTTVVESSWTSILKPPPVQMRIIRTRW